MKYAEYIDLVMEKHQKNMNERPSEWVIPERLPDKVSADGRMNDFFGATTVIKLSDRDRHACEAVQRKLVELAGDMLVELIPDTFHLTIHSLSNFYNVSKNNEEIQRSIDAIDSKIKAEFRRIYDKYKNATIKMRSLGASTNWRDVVSIKFVPCNEDDYELLMDLYKRIDAIFPLPDFFNPHVSLAYFKPQIYSYEKIAMLYDGLRVLDQPSSFEIDLAIENFVYQYHYHMNDYKDIPID